MVRGEPQMDVGPRTDIVDGCPKALAIPMVLRAMNPQIIAADEITLREHLRAMSLAAGCGVNQFHHKVGGALCTLRRSGGSETYHQLLATMDCMEMVLVTADYWGVAHGAEPGEVMGDTEGLDVAAQLGRNMAWMVKVLAESKVPVPERGHRAMTNFIR